MDELNQQIRCHTPLSRIHITLTREVRFKIILKGSMSRISVTRKSDQGGWQSKVNLISPWSEQFPDIMPLREDLPLSSDENREWSSAGH